MCMCIIGQIFKQTEDRSVNKFCVNNTIYHDMQKDRAQV